jgi:hypothetical protein
MCLEKRQKKNICKDQTNWDFWCVGSIFELRFSEYQNKQLKVTWRRGLVVQSPLATVEIGAMGRGIESRRGIG